MGFIINPYLVQPSIPAIITTNLVMNLDAGNPLSYSGTGTTWTDLTGNGNNGNLLNGVSYSSANQGSLVFDGTDDNVRVNSTTITNRDNNLTVEFWYKGYYPLGGPTVAQLWYTRYPSGGFNLNNFDSYWKSTKFLVADNIMGTVPQNDNWHQVVLTYSSNSSSGVRFYVDGALNAFNTNTQNVSIPSGGYLTIGLAESMHRGNISICRFYNSVLSASDILQNFNAVKGRYGL